MEKRSRRRIRDLVALAASQGLSENEIGCARISMMARSINPPCKGRIQKRKTNHLQIITFGLQRNKRAISGIDPHQLQGQVSSENYYERIYAWRRPAATVTCAPWNKRCKIRV